MTRRRSTYSMPGSSGVENGRMSEPKYLFRCGTPPGPGGTVWVGDREYVVTEDGQNLRPITGAVERAPVATRIVGWLFCPACLLPRFIPGHRLRGCRQP